MSDEAPEQEQKTEDPSEKKLRDAHERGDVVKSQEVSTWFVLSGSALVFSMLAVPTSQGLAETFRGILANADRLEVGSSALTNIWISLAGSILVVALIPSVVLTAFAIVGNLIQHRPLLSLDPLKPKLEKISPIAGFKRLFSAESLVNFVKGIAKIAIVSIALWVVLGPEISSMGSTASLEPGLILSEAKDLSIKIFAAVLAVVTVIAIVDYVYQRNRWWSRLKMTLQEVKDEFKQQEGDPHIKGRIRALRMERAKKRMMSAVPKATVVVTNPTHFAVALLYDRSMNAPQCVAKGTDRVALRIREIATEAGVPIVENPPLARALYKSVDIDETIPGEHFKAVAEVIGFVMRLKQKSGWRPVP